MSEEREGAAVRKKPDSEQVEQERAGELVEPQGRLERRSSRWGIRLGRGAVLDPATGALRIDPDLRLPSRGMPVEISFHYDSQDDYNGAFGYGRTTSYNRFLEENVPQAGKVTVHTGTGRRYVYTNNNGGYDPPAGNSSLFMRMFGESEE